MNESKKENKKNLKYDFTKILASSTRINKDFQKIWNQLYKEIRTTDFITKDAFKDIENLVLYNALDGSRTVLTSKPFIEQKDDAALFLIAFIHTLKTLGAKSCVIILHTSYNRERGKKEFERILNTIKSGSELIKQFSLENDIKCNCLCINPNYELRDVLEDVEHQTKNGSFNTYFLFDYNEKWNTTVEGNNIIESLPDINVHIRHTKFNFSGGWIPDKMKKSAFLYSQNGTAYTNWEPDEIVALVAISLIAKKFHEGEGLSKKYLDMDEIQHRYIKREKELFGKDIFLRKNPKKKFVVGSPIGIYQIFY